MKRVIGPANENFSEKMQIMRKKIVIRNFFAKFRIFFAKMNQVKKCENDAMQKQFSQKILL